MSSGKIGEAFKAGLVSAATAAAFYGVGEATDFHGADMSKFLTGDHFANIAGHALVGCLSATASGGRCGAGALSAGLSGFAGPVVAGLGGTGGLVASTALGGVGSVLGGGKFENGAITGAFGYLFNAVAGTYDRATGKLTLVDLEDGRSVTADYLSGGKFGGPVPPGTYDILERAGKDEFRLEARDATYGDDHEDSSGRGLFRLHGPGASNGCVTACTLSDWTPVRDLLNSTSVSNSTVKRYWGPSIFGGTVRPLGTWSNGTEILKNYGTLVVK